MMEYKGVGLWNENVLSKKENDTGFPQQQPTRKHPHLPKACPKGI